MLIMNSMIPRYMKVAHWVYEQKRFVCSRETAKKFGVSAWAIGEDFSKIRLHPEVIVFEEQSVSSRGGKKYLLRIHFINTYQLDDNLQPLLSSELPRGDVRPLTWRDLTSRKWDAINLHINR